MHLKHAGLPVLVLSLVFCSAAAHALTKEQEQIINKRINIMKESCLVYSKNKEIDFSANTDLALILKRLPSTGVSGGAKYKLQESEGFVSNLQKEITKEGLTLSQQQLECTSKFGAMIFESLAQELRQRDAIRSRDSEPTTQNVPSATQERRDFVLTEGASEILTDEGRVFTVNRVIYRADTNFIQVKLDGQNHQLEPGMSLKLNQRGSCQVILREILKKNNALFHLRCS